MCNFFSAIWTRDKQLCWHWCTDHHSDLMAIFGLKDSSEKHFVRIEFTPPSDLKTVTDVSTWNFDLDEQRRPGWFDEEDEGECRKKLESIISSHIVNNDRDVLVDGPWILTGDAKVNRVISGRIALMLGSSNVGEMWESSKVGAMRESSNVGAMRESSNVGEMWGSSKVGAMRESSKVIADKRTADQAK
jgi:hypothetical protein